VGQASGSGDRGLPNGRGDGRVTRGGAQPFGCCFCRCCLGGALLRLAKIGHRLGERGQAGNQRGRGEHRFAGHERGGRQQPGRTAQAVTGRAAAGIRP
jgi:hypothetical protein